MNRFKLAPSLGRYLVIAALAFAALPAWSVSPLIAKVELEVPFEPGSFKLPKSSASELGNQMPCLNSISLEVVIIKAPGDNAPSKLDGVAQMKLAAERANALRQFFLNLGIPDKKIYTQAEATVEEASWGQPLRPSGGTAKIEYTGVCKAGATNADCQTLCTPKQP